VLIQHLVLRYGVLLCAAAGMVRARPLATGSVVGRVREERSGRPVARALVRVPGARLGAFTDSSGWFRFDGVPALKSRAPTYEDTTVLVSVRHLGYLPEQREVLVRDGQSDTVMFLLRPDPRPVR
jgi:Carboxypeptidase regulatory-like domain